MFDADILAVQMLPEWPSATTLLRRFVSVLYSKRGLQHADNAVKLMCVDFTGLLASRLCIEAKVAEDEAEWIADLMKVVTGEHAPPLPS